MRIGNFRVNVKRCELVNESQIVTLQPKVLQVLLLLAERPGEVVSHEEILDSIWPNVVIEPNTLQRCIAQLRKALGDDAKKQSAIKTHPKLGYSLLLDVALKTDINQLDPGLSTNNNKHLFISVISIAAVAVLVWGLLIQKGSQPKQLTINNITPVTATDHFEFEARLSPSAQQVAFLRQFTGCNRGVFIKDLQTGREWQLSRQQGKYNNLRWSTDGKHLAASKESACALEALSNNCSELLQWGFNSEVTNGIEAKRLLSCDKNEVVDMEWTSDQDIVFISKDTSGYAKVQQLNTKSGKLSAITLESADSPYSLSYSAINQQLAILSQGNDGNKLSLLDKQNSVLKRVTLASQSSLYKNARWAIDWHSSGEFLISSAGKNLVTIQPNGSLSFTSLPTLHNLRSPSSGHQDGVMAVTISRLDWDLQQWNMQAQATEEETVKTLFVSNAEESVGAYQPKGNLIAFNSEKNGSKQLFLGNTDTGIDQQISQFPAGANIGNIVWESGGTSLWSTANGELIHFQINVDASLSAIAAAVDTPFNVEELFQMTQSGELLIKILHEGLPYLALWSPTTELKLVYQGDFFWAQVWEGNVHQYFLRDFEQHIYLLKDKQVTPVAFAETTADSRFLIRGNQLISASSGRLWSYDLNSQTIQYHNSPIAISKLKDIDLTSGNVLFTRWISEQKEIALLSNY